MAKKKPSAKAPSDYISPQETLLSLSAAALNVAKTARKNHKSLNGDNYYANKMANLRADATNSYRRLAPKSVGDSSALAELLETVFSVNAAPKARTQATRDLQYALKTTWAKISEDSSHLEESGVFPLVKLNETNRGYLVSIGRQMNGCYAAGWLDACAVMMRRLLESSIIEAFEARKKESKIKNPKTGDFVQLTALIDAALGESSWNLPRNVKKDLPKLRDLGHRSAHNRYFLATKSDIDKYSHVYRETLEAFLHLAQLLK